MTNAGKQGRSRRKTKRLSSAKPGRNISMGSSNAKPRVTAVLETEQLKLQLLENINQALKAYESQRATLLQQAMNEGGVEQVEQMETEYNALQSCYFELLNRMLAANGLQYEKLMDQTIAVTKNIKQTIEGFQSTIDLINHIAAAVNLVGRIIVLFGA